MQIHELNTKALTDPAYVPFDDGTDTYKANFHEIIDDAVAEAFTDADVSGGVVNYESEDGEPMSGASWSPFDTFEGGESLEDLFTLVSEMAYNLRWLYSKSLKYKDVTYTGVAVTTAWSSLYYADLEIPSDVRASNFIIPVIRQFTSGVCEQAYINTNAVGSTPVPNLRLLSTISRSSLNCTVRFYYI